MLMDRSPEHITKLFEISQRQEIGHHLLGGNTTSHRSSVEHLSLIGRPVKISNPNRLHDELRYWECLNLGQQGIKSCLLLVGHVHHGRFPT